MKHLIIALSLIAGLGLNLAYASGENVTIKVESNKDTNSSQGAVVVPPAR